MQLVTTAIIKAVDNLTPTLDKMAARVQNANRSIKDSASRTGAHVGKGMAAGAAGAFSIGGMLEKAEEFNKHIFGIGAGQLVDEKTGQAKVEFAVHEMEKMAAISLDMGRNMKFSSTKIAEMGEVLVKAGMKENLEDMMKASVSLSKADTETPAKNIADFLHTMSVLYKKDYDKGPGDFIREQADMILTAADQTKLSVGSIMSGMRQFQSVGANLGLGTADMLPMLMAGVQRGFGADEFGTMLKSDFGRLLKRTGQGQSVLSRLGIDMNDEKFTTGTQSFNETAMAMRNIRNSTRQYGSLGKNDAGMIQTMIEAGARKVQDGTGTRDEVIDRITAHLSKIFGKTTDKDRASLRREVEASVLTKTGDLNPLAVMQAMIEKGASQADFDTVFEGRHSARNAALRQSLSAGEIDQWKQLLKRMKGQGLDGVEALWSKSAFGNVQAMKAAWERLFIVMANTPVIQSAVNSIEKFMDGLGKIDGKTANTAATLGLIAVAAGPLTYLLRGLLTPFGLIAGGAVLLTQVMGGAGGAIDGFMQTFNPLMSSIKASPEMRELQQSLDQLFGSGSGTFNLGVTAANALVTVMRNVVDGLNLMRGAMEAVGLIKPQPKEKRLSDGRIHDDVMGDYRPTSAVKEATSYFADLDQRQRGYANDAWEKVKSFFTGEQAKAGEGAEATKASAGLLANAAAALERAAGSVQNMSVPAAAMRTGAAAPAPVTANPQQYGGK